MRHLSGLCRAREKQRALTAWRRSLFNKGSQHYYKGPLPVVKTNDCWIEQRDEVKTVATEAIEQSLGVAR
eukprot:1125414-Amphidinium_carterae.1